MHALFFTAAAATLQGGGPISVPRQYFYTKDHGVGTQEQGCSVMRWEGMDVLGSAGYPAVATVRCPHGATHKATGVAAVGPLHIYLGDGRLTVNNKTLSLVGSSYWINAGARAEVEISGFAYIVGAPYELAPGREAYFSRAYGEAPVTRAYDVSDAIRGVNNATILHDIHINNGSTDNNCKDIAWRASTPHTDPAAVTVVNCAEGISTVAEHYHPMGALYIPYSGEICFNVSSASNLRSVKCIDPGFPRWTSPMLRYAETFTNDGTGSTPGGVAELVANTGPWSPTCPFPTVFSVTHFDVWGGSAGVPNFEDDPGQSAKQVAFRYTQHLTTVVQYKDDV
eukprot:Hpha_TRINITY_DN15406_c0_g2::TRINITY_DN15406_c0_g2_i3::g.172895::m.172895